MTASKSHAYFTPEQYLEIERISPIKHEYIDGQIIAMAGATKAHVLITGNYLSHFRSLREFRAIVLEN
jgi:Uma2 family endonuclease